jgi:hypothetical protein
VAIYLLINLAFNMNNKAKSKAFTTNGGAHGSAVVG